MTKQQLIAEFAKETGVTKRHAEYMLSRLTCIIEKHVSKGEKVAITGFGTFDLTDRTMRRGMNPATKKPMTVPAMKLPRFRAGTQFKSLVR